MENRYKVVYTGELQPYVSAQEAIRNVAAMFKVPENSIHALVLGGRARDIKVDLDRATAERYVGALSKAGLAVHIEPMGAPQEELRLAPIAGAEAVAAGGDRGEVCPKCRAAEVRDGICGACGIVVAKYLARMAGTGGPLPAGAAPGTSTATRSPNPYAPPRAALTPEARPQGKETLTGPHAVPAGHGWDWISRGFWHFKTDPWTWILVTIAYFIISMAVSLVPFAGAIAAYLIAPIFMGGLMLGASDQGHGERLGFHHLFAGFSNQTGRLLAAGALYLGGIFLAAIPAILLLGPMALGVAGMGPAMHGQDPQLMAGAMEDMMAGRTLLLAVLVAVLLMLPVVMAYWFAPALIAIDGLRAWPAMKLSFMGCLKNLLPFLIYGLAGLVLIFLGSLPVLLGLLVVMPTLTASIYTSYRDIFYRKP